MRKYILCFLMAVVFCLSAIVSQARDATPRVVIGNVEARAGQDVAVPVKLENNPGIIALDFAVDYDETKAELIGVEKGDYNLTDAPIQSPYVFNWADGASDDKTNENVGVMNFHILDGAEGTVDLTVTIRDPDNFVNAAMETVIFETADGGITILSGADSENDPDEIPDIPDDEFMDAIINSKKCYIATAVYGSYDCPEVWTLRRFRDHILGENWYGRAFIRTYYAISPAAIKLFGETEWFQTFWRDRLDKLVTTLQKNGVESAPYTDRVW